ncbi:MAG: response regulator [bacterium]
MADVLLVDDEKNVLATLSLGLKKYNYSVKKAQSGSEALKIIEEEPCKVVVTDIRMNPMDGFTLAEKLFKRYNDINVIFMSAYSEDNEKFRSNFSCPRLTKPFDISELVEEIKKFLGK